MKSKVYLVDDHPLLRDGITRLINRQKDLTVCGESENISGALKGIPEKKPDIAIVDLTLEDGSGLSLVEKLSSSHSTLPVLVLSMHDESVYAERCLKAGARGYIMKREPPKEVLSALRTILEGRLYISEKLGPKLINKFLSNKLKPSQSPVDYLTTRELEVYQLIGKGLQKKEIAEQLNLRIKTVENYTEHLKKKMNFKNLHETITHAIKFNSENTT